jgi:hypothetical protein
MPECIYSLLFLYSHVLFQKQDRPYNAAIAPPIFVLLYIRTHHLMACFMFGSRLFFWTAKSMTATTLSESALAVISMRSVGRPHLCIPVGQKSAQYVIVDNKILTLQTYERWSSTKASQIMFSKRAFYFVFEIHSWITTLIF